MKNKFIQTFLIATAMVFAVASTAFAGYWGIENGEWRYFDDNNNIVTESWAKSGDNWYYLDSTGNMVTNDIIDDDGNLYYLDNTGAMVTNQWIFFDGDWYCFGANGKAHINRKGEITNSSLHTINEKKYAFDVDGKMLYGWIDAESATMLEEDDGWKTATYYAGNQNEGWIVTGWHQIEVEDDDGLVDYWFYFLPTGKKNLNEKKTINGVTYRFDPNDGHMLSEWVEATPSSASPSNLNYLNGDGAMVKKGWIYAIPDEDYIPEDYEDDEYSWWYASNNGEIVKNTIKKINGKYYAFDEKGRMLYGLVTVEDGDYTNKSGDVELVELTGDDIKNSEFEKLYYFSDTEDDGSRKSGTIKITLDDETYNFYFKSNGEAEDGYVSKIKKFTSNGIILEADSDEGKFAGVDAEYNDGYTLNSGSLSYGNSISEGQILINTSGAIAKNKNNVNDGNDIYIFTDKNGVVVYAGDKLKSKKDGSIEVKGKTYEID